MLLELSKLQTFSTTKRFHSLPEGEKMRYEMDNLGPEHGGLKGVGYLRERNKKLPARDKGSSKYEIPIFVHF